MRIGVPKEIKNMEKRVGLTPQSVAELHALGHQIVVQADAGNGIGAPDSDYTQAGATIADTAEEIFADCEMIVKVKEPQAVERKMLRKNQLLFTYLHLAPDPDQTHDLLESGATCVAYETVTDEYGNLPLLAPMSIVAGRLATQAGAYFLGTPQGGSGMLLGGVPGVGPAKVVIIGGGVVGSNAAQMAVGLGADVLVLDRNISVLSRLEERFGSQIKTLYSSASVLTESVVDADLVIGAVLVKGARAPHLVSADMIKRMRNGSVVVDVAIDQGGCFETSRPTTHSEPSYEVDGVVHYCVANMPGAVPKTSTYALNNATLPFVVQLANHGIEALRRSAHLRNGLNVIDGHLTEPAAAEALDLPFVSPEEALGL